MSVLLFLAVTFGAGTAALLTRRRPSVSIPIGIAGLAAATLAAFMLSSGDRLQVGETALVVSGFQRLFLLFASVAGLSVSAIALTGAWQRNLPSAMLLGLGTLALGLGLADPVSRLAATAAAGLPGVLVAITTPVDARGVRAAARELRAVAVTGALAVVAAALVSGPTGLAHLSPTIVGLAYLAMALAVAVRMGAIPFHTRVARVTGSAPGAALPLLLAWAPAGFAAAALVWIDWNISTTALPLEPERLVIVAVGLLCILLGIIAATIQDDIEHIVGYSVIQDAGFVMLALAIFDVAAWEPARSWLLIYVATKSAFAGWALAMRDTFGTGRIGELSGWIRRAPVLALALAAIVVATVGVPGLLVFDVRSRIASLALGEPLAILAVAGGLGSLLYYGRLARVGIGPVAPMVAAYTGIRPHGLALARAAAMSAASGDIEGDGVVAPGDASAQSSRTAAPEAGGGQEAPTTEARTPLAGAARPATSTADADGVVADDTPAAMLTPAAMVASDAVAPTPAAMPAAASAPDPRRSASVDLSALRRDPKEITRLWAREALERAGLSPTTGDDAEPASLARAPAPPTVSAPATEAVAGRDAWGSGGPEEARAERPRRGRRPAVAADPGATAAGSNAALGRGAVARALWSENRSLVSASLALLLAIIGLVAAAGGFGVAEAARAPAPLTGGSDTYVQGQPSSSGQPGSPGVSPGPPGTPGTSAGPGVGAPTQSPAGSGPQVSPAATDQASPPPATRAP